MQIRKRNFVNLHVRITNSKKEVHETSHVTSQRFINNGLSVYESLKIYLQAYIMASQYDILMYIMFINFTVVRRTFVKVCIRPIYFYRHDCRLDPA